MRPGIIAIAFALIAGPLCFAQTGGATVAPTAAGDSETAYVPVHTFDAKRDASADIQAAIAEARRSGKRIILYLGGDWCAYCGQMSKFFARNPDLVRLRDENFVTVYVYYGGESHDEKALAAYGKFVGIPHYFVLASDGRLLHSEHLLDLRAKGDYSAAKMKDFLAEWAPKKEP